MLQTIILIGGLFICVLEMKVESMVLLNTVDLAPVKTLENDVAAKNQPELHASVLQDVYVISESVISDEFEETDSSESQDEDSDLSLSDGNEDEFEETDSSESQDEDSDLSLSDGNEDDLEVLTETGTKIDSERDKVIERSKRCVNCGRRYDYGYRGKNSCGCNGYGYGYGTGSLNTRQNLSRNNQNREYERGTRGDFDRRNWRGSRRDNDRGNERDNDRGNERDNDRENGRELDRRNWRGSSSQFW